MVAEDYENGVVPFAALLYRFNETLDLVVDKANHAHIVCTQTRQVGKQVGARLVLELGKNSVFVGFLCQVGS